KAILDTYGDSTILKRRREDDDQEGPSAGSDRGSKRQKEGGEHASASTPSKKATRNKGRTTKGTQSRQMSASESALAEEPFYGYAVNRESTRDVDSKRRIIAVTELQIMEWHDYKHLDWIS
nr:hypothetical protein [Tanacetum cinerariifolium]